MPQRETASSMDIKSSIVVQSAASTVDGAAVDVTDADAQTIVIELGATVDAAAEFDIQEDDGAGGWTSLVPVQEPTLDGVLYGQDYPAAGVGASTIYRYAYVGSSETIRVRLHANGGATLISATVIAEKLFERANLSGFLEA